MRDETGKKRILTTVLTSISGNKKLWMIEVDLILTNLNNCEKIDFPKQILNWHQ